MPVAERENSTGNGPVKNWKRSGSGAQMLDLWDHELLEQLAVVDLLKRLHPEVKLGEALDYYRRQCLPDEEQVTHSN